MSKTTLRASATAREAPKGDSFVKMPVSLLRDPNLLEHGEAPVPRDRELRLGVAQLRLLRRAGAARGGPRLVHSDHRARGSRVTRR
jgi:hypothetical protein